ncbi:Maf family protein [Micrococcus luteus]|uniref:Maf family protein n=1 Tax=Micrococcus luteus TaxID=1270 RepID=UPI0012DC02B0|nr:nucleoside triphosphate pyrophosphatase [Micrococcus luteus]QGS21767.1 septum formation protein Maf [Micrococcus luteus]QGY89765.1 septum formation protein Maf [Micrococcus luteus]QHG59346.1 septum formation protein Maf [Micrococcus luteus]
MSPVTSPAHDDAAAGPDAPLALVLGSASPGRADVLRRAQVPFRVLVSDVDEDAVGAAAARDAGRAPSPGELAGLLAAAKGRDVAARVVAEGVDRPTLVLGCDSVFEFEGSAYGKPYEPEVAVQRWRAQAGRMGTLHTGHWLGLVLPDGTRAEREGVVSAEVTFAAVDEPTIRAYVATGEPLHCAGAFTIDGAGAALVESVHGDPNAVIGLSVVWLRRAASELGVALAALWRVLP